MLLRDLVETSRRVTATASRLAKTAHLAELLRRADPAEARAAVAFLSGDLLQGRIGIGHAAVHAARPEAAETAALTVAEVDAVFDRLRAIRGAGSKAARAELLDALLHRATADEQDFLRRLLLGELRQGALEGVMVDAVAEAARVPASDVRRAVMAAGDVTEVAHAALAEGSAGLARFRLELFRPLQPMLAQTAVDPEDALTRLGRAAFEQKLDGARVQVHRSGDRVRVFSRRLNEVTESVPEVVEAALALPAHDLVLDGEAIALRADGSPEPFQVTMRRFGRRTDVAALRRTLPLSTFFFDCLHRDGADLIDHPAEERAAALEALLPETMRVPRLVTADAAEAERFLEATLRRGHEGVIAKALEAPYETGRRGGAWLKIKRAHTLDLVVLAAEWGSGRRSGWLSNLHLGARDPATGGFVMLGKTFKGMTDAMLRWQTERFLELETGREGHVVFVAPEVVVEVAFDGLQESPVYPGGLALRFARVKGYRPDKRAPDADTILTVRALFAGQREPG